MTTPFPGFPPEALQFLRSLKRHNDREWFQPRKEKFEEVLRNPMLALLDHLNGSISKFAPDYVAEPSKAIFRIYRDTRFSKDKSPYKTHIAAVFSHRVLPRNHGAGFYFQISTDNVGIGGGIYQPGGDLLKKLREHIAANPAEYASVIRKIRAGGISGEFEGQPLTRVPKGWDPDHPAAELLKCRSLFFYASLPAETALEPRFAKEIATRFRAVAPLVRLLDQAILGGKLAMKMESF